jgi:hypothetical protein
MKKKLVTSLLIFVFSNLFVFGQFQRPQVSSQSPNAATLGTSGEIPVSMYTGIPQIGIPLHTLEEGQINVPISLNYHASGVRPNQHPGWVGMGWNLMAGGAITRRVMDNPDDLVSNDPNAHAFFESYPLLNPSTSNWESTSYLTDLTGPGRVSDFNDTEPDEFSFNFLGFSGSFYLDAVMYQPDKYWTEFRDGLSL